MYSPTYEEFKSGARSSNIVPIYKEIFADLDTPVSAYLKIADGECSYLLESVQGGEKWARYSFIGIEPMAIFKCKGDAYSIGGPLLSEVETKHGDPIDGLKALLSSYRVAQSPGLPRFFGGAVGYIGYDMVRFFEKLPDLARDDLGLPDAMFAIAEMVLIFDNLSQKIKIVCNARVPKFDVRTDYDLAISKIEAVVEKLKRPAPAWPASAEEAGQQELESNIEKGDFLKAVLKAKDYIRRGDVIQVVLSQRFKASIKAKPYDVYRALRTVNPSPYMFYLKFGDMAFAGASPELLVRLERGKVEVRPIAGTRPRGRNEEEDRELERDLLADPKERAEHIMLVDLARNDVGRIAKVGTVKATELMGVERYSHVMHIVSNVVGELDARRDCYEVLRACFPAGTVSGAPKIRAMEIIEELEPTKRGPYAGAVGYFSFSGDMDTCITIRSILFANDNAYFQVGAGIVADSDPEREYQETINKGKAMERALNIARMGLR